MGEILTPRCPFCNQPHLWVLGGGMGGLAAKGMAELPPDLEAENKR